MLCSPLRRKKEKKPPQWLAPATASHGYWACGCMTIFSSNSLQKGWHPTHDDLTDRLGRAKSQQDCLIISYRGDDRRISLSFSFSILLHV